MIRKVNKSSSIKNIINFPKFPTKILTYAFIQCFIPKNKYKN